MKRAALIVVVVIVMTSASVGVAAGCKGECPDGHLSVCVEVDGDCECRCAEDVDAGSEGLARLLLQEDVSEESVEEAVERYRELAEDSEKSFTFELQDQGRVFLIHGTGENYRTDSVIVTS